MHLLLGRRTVALLQGLADGFCGCLSTVSSWAAEVHQLATVDAQPRRAIAYSLGSVAAAQAILLPVFLLGRASWG